MKLATILEISNSGVISIEEREHIRRILGVQDIATDTYFQKSEDRFNLISKRVADSISAEQETKNIFLCKELRALYQAYDKLGDDMTIIDGGSDAIKTSAIYNRKRIAIMLYNKVFPTVDKFIPNEDIFSAMAELEKPSSSESDTFKSVSVSFGDTIVYDSEY